MALKIKSKFNRLKNFVARSIAKLWNRLYWFRFHLLRLQTKHLTFLIILVFSVLIGLSLYFAPQLQILFEPHFSEGNRISSLKAVFITLGGALVGAGAISFSLVMFAMQINIERMPHGLFGRFSTDKKVVFAFAYIFLLAVGIASLSLFVEPRNLAVPILVACWAAILIVSLVVYAYRRTLVLINPIKQLTKIIDDTRKELNIWEKRAKRARPLFQAEEKDSNEEGDSRFGIKHDTALATYFQLNQHWILEPKKAIDHAMSFARRYTEYGDYTVSRSAFDVIAEVNALYIQAKGKTFFSDSILMSSPFSTDELINHTLEHLRKTLSIGFSRKDEQQIEQTLHAFTKLTILYADIDYASEFASKEHANLATAYLSEGVQSALRHGYTDVVMQGLRWMGQAAATLLVKSSPKAITRLVKDIGIISCGGIINEKTQPATLTGVEQLAMLTFHLLHSKNGDIGFAAKQIKNNISMIAKMLLELPDVPLASQHSSTLAPYYSGTSYDTLQAKLLNLTNSLIKAEASDETAQRIIKNIETWVDGIYQIEKELLLLAIEKQSFFTADIIHWIAKLSEFLLALSKAPACPEHTQKRLEEHALYLFSTLSFIEDKKETIAFVETYGLTETLFEMVFEARTRECLDFAEKAWDILVAWAFKAGKHVVGWAILERSVYALATLALVADSEPEINRLKTTITNRLNEQGGIDQEERDRAARNIRERAATLYRRGHWSSEIEMAMEQQDEDKLKPLLEDIQYSFPQHSRRAGKNRDSLNRYQFL